MRLTMEQEEALGRGYEGGERSSLLAYARRVAELGLGFHVDTRGVDYVKADGSRVFGDAEALAHDALVEEVSGITDPYQVAFDVWAMLGLISWQEAREA